MNPDRKTILVVDDEADVARYLAAALEDAGFDVVVAGDAEEGLARLAETRPDLVCLDLVLPGPTGLSLYREIRETPATAALPVVVVTGLNPADAAARARYGEGVPPPDAWFDKPIDVARLVETVSGLVGAGGRA